MSRDYINPDEVPGDVAASLRRIADADERIADNLDTLIELLGTWIMGTADDATAGDVGHLLGAEGR